MTDRFLRASAAQVLLAVVGLPFADLLIGLPTPIPFVFFALATPISGAMYYAWMRAIVVGVNRRLPRMRQRSTMLTDVGWSFALIYNTTFLSVANSSRAWYPPVWVLVPHVIGIAAASYAVWLAGTQLATLKSASAPGFWTKVGQCFLVWWFPIGAWFIQPRLRQCLEAADTTAQ